MVGLAVVCAYVQGHVLDLKGWVVVVVVVAVVVVVMVVVAVAVVIGGLRQCGIGG